MLQSRFSIPLIALFILAIAACMLYLVNAQNIFKTHFSNYVNHVTTADNSQNTSALVYESLQPKTAIENELEKEVSSLTTRRQPLKNVLGDADEPVDSGNSVTTKSDAHQTQNEDVKTVSFDVGAYQNAEDKTAAYSRDAEIRSLWIVYSQHVPSLYSAPLNRDTQEKLARIAQISIELDQLYVSDQSEWLNRFNQVRSDLIEQAVKGEREGARVLSFQYVQQAADETINALTWAMIANSIAANNYYLYICYGDKAWLCSERSFSKASEQAQTIIHDYGFTLRK